MAAIGQLRHRLTLETPVDTPDGAGGTVRSWEPVATVWAQLEPLSADERMAAGRIEAAATHRVIIRHRDGVTHAMRFVTGERRFAMRGIVDPGERRRFLEILCEETVP